MRWRNQRQNKNTARNLRNHTLDSFFSGLSTNSSSNSSSRRNSNVIPKIKVPHSSGLCPVLKPLELPFLYPEYPEFRQYQYTISLKCITENTLVCLPTGLGKTQIASVVILNFHRWFPQGLIFFLAPTKPLVDQQSLTLSNYKQYIEPNKVFQLTGSIAASKRVKVYKQKRIIYCTPQILENDLKNKRIDQKNIVLVIIDEAHRAVGNYSYANVVRLLDASQFGYRVVGLSATPGNDHDKIQEVIENLQISTMLVKNDTDPDIKKYIKQKTVQPVFIEATALIREIEKIMNEFISWPLNQLLKFKLFDRHLAGGRFGFNPKCFFLINQQICQRIRHIPVRFVFLVNSAKVFLKFLADSLCILREAGYQSFKRRFIYVIEDIKQDDGGYEKVKIHQNFIQILREHEGYRRIKELMEGTTNAKVHPKLQKLRELLQNFFSTNQSKQNKSKVIIFANFRSTCHQIHKYISQPPFDRIIKSQIFIGQSKTTVQTRDGENSKTETLCLKQKDQISLIKRYKNNEINTLISTSIGEEGLDIGEVDAIFCYEGGMSMIRMVQRMGRTGRKRDGTVYMLLMEGKQSDDFEKANKKAEKMKKINTSKFKYYSFNPVLFDDRAQIPIHFFSKPSQQQLDKLQLPQHQDNKKLKNGRRKTQPKQEQEIEAKNLNEKDTKRKKTGTTKGKVNEAKTKKNKQKISTINEVTQKSEQSQKIEQKSVDLLQNSESGTATKSSEKSEKREFNDRKLIKITNNVKNKINYDLSQSESDQRDQISFLKSLEAERQIDEEACKIAVLDDDYQNGMYFGDEEAIVNYISYYEDSDSESYADSSMNFVKNSQPNEQFDRLFDINILLEDSEYAEQENYHMQSQNNMTQLSKLRIENEQHSISRNTSEHSKYLNKNQRNNEQKQEVTNSEQDKSDCTPQFSQYPITQPHQEIIEKDDEISAKQSIIKLNHKEESWNKYETKQQQKQQLQESQQSQQDNIQQQIFKQYQRLKQNKLLSTNKNFAQIQKQIKDGQEQVQDSLSQNSSQILDKQQEIEKQSQFTHIDEDF